MKKLAIFLLSVFLIASISNNSALMFSIEEGGWHPQIYDLGHILSSGFIFPCSACAYNNGILTSNQNFDHSHVVLLNSIAKDDRDTIISRIRQIPITSIFPAQRKLYLSPLTDYQRSSGMEFKSNSSQKSSSLQTTILLI